MNKRHMLLAGATLFALVWAFGLLDDACVATGKSLISCNSLTSVLIGLLVGGLVSFWASAQVAAASDRDARTRLNGVVDQLTGTFQNAVNRSQSSLEQEIRGSLSAAKSELISSVDNSVKASSQALIDRMQRDLESLTGILTKVPLATATALEVKQAGSLLVSSLPLLVKAMPHLVELLASAKQEPPPTTDAPDPPASGA